MKANKLKKQAYEYGYIELKYNYFPYELNGKALKIEKVNKPLFRKIFYDVGHKMRIDKSGRYYASRYAGGGVPFIQQRGRHE